ncbi:sialidase family protein [Methylococcus sp. EFPC2]|uniref:sialidase family protein n=1 Tax=Methylococcus sp. EFPC2 TaxID=2812648 RepID=UPI001967256E|nr:sialidase family protein [Methylococcus sp. EFPC2]QSA97720.1 exo-alpha-sialidase [Methylococcus sp. EFPC2]
MSAWILFAGLVLSAAPLMAWSDGARQLPDIAGLYDIQSLDVAADARGIHVLAVGKTQAAAQPRLVYTITADGGRTWRKPSVVDRGGTLVASRLGNDAQLAVHGLTMAVAWQRSGDPPGSGPMAAAYSRDGGITWQQAQAPQSEDPTQQQSYMDLAADRSGRFHLVWLDDREENGNTQGLRHAISSDGGRSWREEATVDAAVCTCCWNRLTVLPDDSIAVLYRDDAPHDMRLALRAANGRWQGLGAVGEFNWDFAGCPHCGGGLATARTRHGTVLHSVVWTGKEDAAGLYYLASADQGKTWSVPRRIADASSREADIAVYGDAGVGIVYTRPAEEGSAVYYVHTKDGGGHWTPARRISASATQADHPRILGEGAGGIAAFWTEHRTGAGRVLAMASLSDG